MFHAWYSNCPVTQSPMQHFHRDPFVQISAGFNSVPSNVMDGLLIYSSFSFPGWQELLTALCVYVRLRHFSDSSLQISFPIDRPVAHPPQISVLLVPRPHCIDVGRSTGPSFHSIPYFRVPWPSQQIHDPEADCLAIVAKRIKDRAPQRHGRGQR